jgi:hypothetical protein
VPKVLAVDEECLILRWVEPGKVSSRWPTVRPGARGPTRPARRRTASTRTASSASCRCPTSRADLGGVLRDPAGAALPQARPATAAASPRRRRHVEEVFGATARDRARGAAGPAARRPVERQRALGPRRGLYLIDPAAYGGHRETDLAMLARSSGCRTCRASSRPTPRSTPLADGWEDRVGIHQLFPLLVHACMFGGGYAARAADASPTR